MVPLLPRDVVLHGSRSGAAYGEGGVSGLPVREEAADNRRRQGRRTILGREDEMKQKGSEGVRHKTYAPLRGSLLLRFDSTRLTPWATVFRPAGLPHEPAEKEVGHRAENSRLKCRNLGGSPRAANAG